MSIITEQEVINDLRRVRDEHGDINSVLYRENGMFSCATVKKTLGLENTRKFTLLSVLAEAADEKPEPMSEDTMKLVIRKTNRQFKKEGVKFTRDNFVNRTPVTKNQINKRFGSWTAAVKASGITK